MHLNKKECSCPLIKSITKNQNRLCECALGLKNIIGRFSLNKKWKLILLNLYLEVDMIVL